MFVEKTNAHLITETIEEFTETGIKTKDGQVIELDLVILATGFKVEESVCGFQTIGRHGHELKQYLEDFPVAFNGITVPNFPNFFFLLGMASSCYFLTPFLFHHREKFSHRRFC